MKHVSLFSMILAAAVAVPKTQASDLVLAENGVAKAIILTPAKPSHLETYAAEQLALYLSKMTGGAFKVVKESDAEAANVQQPVISVGRTSLAEDLPMTGTKWKRKNLEAFRILRRDDALLICGNQEGSACDNGTLWGMYAFLEMQDVGKYLPDDLGEVVPDRSTVTVGDLNFSDAPAFEMRGGDNTPGNYLKRYLPGGDREGEPPNLLAFSRRAAARRVEFFHSWQYVATAKVREEHPEWFENTRNPPYGPKPGPSPHIGYGLSENGICISRPEIRNLFIKFFRDRFRAHPDMYAATICPDDYVLGDRCPCTECQRLLDLGAAPSFPDARGAPRSSSDLLISFVNAVAEGLEDEFPNRKFITLAYLDYLDPPAETRVHPNVIVMPAPLSTRNELSPALSKMVGGWKQKGAETLYWYGYILTRPPIPHLMGEWFRNYKSRGIKGVYLEFSPAPVTNALNGWLYGKLAWNPDADINALIDEYCTGLFGPDVGRIMRRFFIAAWAVNPPLYDEIPRLFSEAERMAGDRDSLLYRRVRFFKLAWGLYYSAIELDDALKRGDIREAHRVAASGVSAAKKLETEYPWSIRANVWLQNTSHMAYEATVLPALDILVNTQMEERSPESVAPGPALCLTNNADIPAAERIDNAVAVSFNPTSTGGLDGGKLFDGKVDGRKHNLSPGSFPIWSITLDLKREHQIDWIEVCTGLTTARWDIVPIYIEVLLSRDGKDFLSADHILPRTLKGFSKSGSLFTTTRYVRLRMASLNMWHAVSEIRIWGRRKAD
jgi:hypothetical protein